MGDLSRYDEINIAGQALESSINKNIERTIREIKSKVNPIHDDMESIIEQLNYSYNQINILRKELDDERAARAEDQKKSEVSTKRANIVAVVSLLVAIASIITDLIRS